MCTKLWLESPKGRERPLKKRGDIWENGIKMDLKETGWEGVDWIHL
jgi:hypothetical protein